MSSEWWTVLAVFWGLYLIDGLRGGRRDRLFFHAWFATKTALGAQPGARSTRLQAFATQSAWFLIPIAPTASTLVSEDLPASLAPEGITNWPSTSATRPPPLPSQIEAFRWEEIQQVEDRSGWIYINRRRFAPHTVGLSARSLGNLGRELAPLSHDARTRRLSMWQASRFGGTHLKRRLQSVLLRSRGLAFLNTVQAASLAAVSVYLLADGPSLVSPALGNWVADALPGLLMVYASSHLGALTWFYRLHRRIYPAAGQERASLLFTALFVPPQALRLRIHLTAKLAAGLHPLSVALACAHPSVARQIATNTLRDLRWPRCPANFPEPVRRLVESSSAILEPIITEALVSQDQSLTPARLLAAPAPHSAQACSYCPRCGDEFTRSDSRCPHGVPLAGLQPVLPVRQL